MQTLKHFAAVIVGLSAAPYAGLITGWLVLFGFEGAEGPVGGIGLILLVGSAPLGILAAIILSSMKPGPFKDWHGSSIFMLMAPACSAVAALPVLLVTYLVLLV